jgi:hypothetical protein
MNVTLPKAVHCTYPALSLSKSPMPSRLLSAFDPILNIGILETCQQAYGGTPRHVI